MFSPDMMLDFVLLKRESSTQYSFYKTDFIDLIIFRNWLDGSIHFLLLTIINIHSSLLFANFTSLSSINLISIPVARLVSDFLAQASFPKTERTPRAQWKVRTLIPMDLADLFRRRKILCLRRVHYGKSKLM